ncbi:MAG: hypothetical protein WEC37_03785 [Anaerolineales bacterium]
MAGLAFAFGLAAFFLAFGFAFGAAFFLAGLAAGLGLLICMGLAALGTVGLGATLAGMLCPGGVLVAAGLGVGGGGAAVEEGGVVTVAEGGLIGSGLDAAAGALVPA